MPRDPRKNPRKGDVLAKGDVIRHVTTASGQGGMAIQFRTPHTLHWCGRGEWRRWAYTADLVVAGDGDSPIGPLVRRLQEEQAEREAVFDLPVQAVVTRPGTRRVDDQPAPDLHQGA